MAKEYDVEIKKLFGDYKRAKSRVAYLERNTLFDKMPESEEGEYRKLKALINVVDTMLSQLSILRQQIIEYYYIYGESLYDIAELLHYSYYHCSNEKNEAIDDLRRIFKSTEFDSIISKEFERQWSELEQQKATNE